MKTYIFKIVSLCKFDLKKSVFFKYIIIKNICLNIDFINIFNTPELQTADDLVYQFFETRRGVFNFKVRAPNDAHLALVAEKADQAPIIEVFIGGWKNTKSVIRKNKTQPEVAEMPTPDILSAGEFRSFWIRWADNVSEGINDYYIVLYKQNIC